MSIILGIDPGSRTTGYGIVEEQAGALKYIDSGCIRTGEGELSDRLLIIFNGICSLLESYAPDEFAIEQIFVHHNASAALKLGHARGVAMVAAASHRLLINEYTPREIKLSVVGYGGAEKSQVQHMIMQVLNLPKAPQNDAADALAAAVCHSHMRNALLLRKKHKSVRRRSV
jgi:crossover junction endodeoxyribonuclease RuvC